MAARKEDSPVNALVLDAGALIAIDRDDRDVHKTVRDAHRMGVQVLTNSMRSRRSGETARDGPTLVGAPGISGAPTPVFGSC